jgi:hypothetical protein
MAAMRQTAGPRALPRGRSGLAPLPLRPQRPRLALPPRALPASELADSLAAQQQHVQALLDLASAAAASAPPPDGAAATGDTSIFAPLANALEAVLKQIQGVLNRAHVPYSYGYSIILLTVLVKILTYPLTKKQVRALHEGGGSGRMGGALRMGDERRAPAGAPPRRRPSQRAGTRARSALRAPRCALCAPPPPHPACARLPRPPSPRPGRVGDGGAVAQAAH